MKLTDGKLFRQQCYINGAWTDADSGDSIDVTNPATGEKLGTIPKMGTAETKRAIEAANAAWPAWRAKTAKERAQILRKWFELMMANQDDLGTLMTAEQGKPPKPKARLPMRHRSSNGSAKRASAPMAIPSRSTVPTSELSLLKSRSALWPRSRLGTSPPR